MTQVSETIARWIPAAGSGLRSLNPADRDSASYPDQVRAVETIGMTAQEAGAD
jgi:hypothetical protein